MAGDGGEWWQIVVNGDSGDNSRWQILVVMVVVMLSGGGSGGGVIYSLYMVMVDDAGIVFTYIMYIKNCIVKLPQILFLLTNHNCIRLNTKYFNIDILTWVFFSALQYTLNKKILIQHSLHATYKIIKH